MTDIAFRVRQAREKLGWSCAETDRRAGLSIGHTARIEAGKGGVTSETLKRLSHALRIAMSKLLEDRSR